MRKLNPPQIVVFSFLITILIGTFLLYLPQSSAHGASIGIIDAFFTATSATCVTGLVVKDTGTDFSHFGQLIILFLFQMGGLGIMTMSTFFAILLGRKLTLRENVVIKSAMDHHGVAGLKTLILYILGLTFFIEGIGAVLLYRRFGEIYPSIFHSISAFCNAGFSLYATSFLKYRDDTFVTVVMMILIILGGIGFIVLLDIRKVCRWFFRRLFLRRREDIKHLFSNISLQTKIVLTITFVLIFLGAAALFILENDRLFYGLSIKNKLLASFFQSITARTAGFNTVPIVNLTSPTLFFLIMLMFIGASPGSTGGGIKTATFGVILAGAYNMLKNRDNIHIFKRTVPKPIFRKAVMITGLAVTWVVVFTMLLSFVEERNMAMPNYFLRMLFEVTSAFGTVGLSTGITPILSSFGKVLIMITMFVGRIGPLTLALAVATNEQKLSYKYPEEKVMVG